MRFKGVVFVDVDNLYIINNHVNVPVLKARVNAVKALNARTHWFGNTFTNGVVKKHKIDIDMIESAIESNSADHNLINYITKTKNKNILVVTGDSTLQRLAAFMNPNKNIRFAKFERNELISTDVDYNFKDRERLLRFLESLALYMRRY